MAAVPTAAGQVGCRPRGLPGHCTATHPSLEKESDWYLADVLRRELVKRGYNEVPEYGWQGRSCEETAWLYALFKTADAVDSEFRRLEAEMRGINAEVQTWSVLREAGPDVGEAAGEEAVAALEPGEVDEEAAAENEYWLQERILIDIFAFNQAHAMYLFAVDFTQPLTAYHPAELPFPRDYRVNIIDLLKYLMRDGEDSGRPDIAGAVGRLINMDLEGYRLVQSHRLPLNKEELEAWRQRNAQV